jgi:hypothetical protein
VDKNKNLRGGIMASNGYVRRDCFDCLFYESNKEYGEWCNLKKELFEADSMRWVSANDCDRSPLMTEKHYEKCEHRTNVKDIKNQVREKFGIEKWNYNK